MSKNSKCFKPDEKIHESKTCEFVSGASEIYISKPKNKDTFFQKIKQLFIKK